MNADEQNVQKIKPDKRKQQNSLGVLYLQDHLTHRCNKEKSIDIYKRNGYISIEYCCRVVVAKVDSHFGKKKSPYNE